MTDAVPHDSEASVLSLHRLRRVPEGVRLIADPDAWLAARGNAYGAENSRIWTRASEGDSGISQQHLELIYDVVLRQALKPGIRVLDLGCGTGPLAVELAGNVGPGGEVHGIDISEHQLERARELAKAHGALNTRFSRVAFPGEFPYEENSFDLVVSHIAFQLMPYKYRCLEQIYRVLKPGGLLALVTDCETSWSRLFNAPESWCFVFDYAERNASAIDGRIHFPLGVFPTLEQMDEWLAKVGFAEVQLSQENPLHRVPPMFNRAYWSVWIDESVLEPVAEYAQETAAQVLPRLGITEPRLNVFARKPQDRAAAEAAQDLGHAGLARSWVRSVRECRLGARPEH